MKRIATWGEFERASAAERQAEVEAQFADWRRASAREADADYQRDWLEAREEDCWTERKEVEK